MKTAVNIALALAAGLTANAALIRFQLSPPGTDTAVGVSPSNQVPVAVASTGSGGEISCGIIFDTDASILQVAVGYGSAGGFTDLTGPATGMHIHGPAGAGANAGVIVSLVPFNFPAANPTNGGVIFANVAWPTNRTDALLNGQTYLNIHTAQFPDGEIRGQLIPLNEAPVVVCPPGQTVECSQLLMLNALFSDPEGDALTVVWSVNGIPAQTDTLPARGAGLPAMDTFTNQLPLGTNVIGVTVTDTATNQVSCTTQVVVQDTTPPVIVSACANPAVLWPPNHKFVNVVVRAQVFDSCSSTSWKITSVTSNEPVNGPGDGNTGPDWIITGDHTLKLRAERAGNGHGRIYTIYLKATDAAGNISDAKTVTVTVPKSQGR